MKLTVFTSVTLTERRAAKLLVCHYLRYLIIIMCNKNKYDTLTLYVAVSESALYRSSTALVLPVQYGARFLRQLTPCCASKNVSLSNFICVLMIIESFFPECLLN